MTVSNLIFSLQDCHLLDEGVHFGHHLVMRDSGARIGQTSRDLGLQPRGIASFLFSRFEL